VRRAQRRPAWNRYRGDCTPPRTVHGPKSGNVMAGCRPGRGGGRESVGGRSLVGRVLRCAITPAPHARAVRTVRDQGPGLVDRPGAFCALRRRRGAEDRRQLSAEHGTTHLAESAAFSGQDDPHITVYKRHWAVPGPLHAGCAPGMRLTQAGPRPPGSIAVVIIYLVWMWLSAAVLFSAGFTGLEPGRATAASQASSRPFAGLRKRGNRARAGEHHTQPLPASGAG